MRTSITRMKRSGGRRRYLYCACGAIRTASSVSELGGHLDSIPLMSWPERYPERVIFRGSTTLEQWPGRLLNMPGPYLRRGKVFHSSAGRGSKVQVLSKVKSGSGDGNRKYRWLPPVFWNHEVASAPGAACDFCVKNVAIRANASECDHWRQAPIRSRRESDR